MKPRHQFKLNLSPDLLVKLKEIAERDSRSVTSLINLMLRRQIEKDTADQN